MKRRAVTSHTTSNDSNSQSQTQVRGARKGNSKTATSDHPAAAAAPEPCYRYAGTLPTGSDGAPNMPSIAQSSLAGPLPWFPLKASTEHTPRRSFNEATAAAGSWSTSKLHPGRGGLLTGGSLFGSPLAGWTRPEVHETSHVWDFAPSGPMNNNVVTRTKRPQLQ